MERVRPQPATFMPGRRKSVFTEVGLVDETTIRRDRSPAPLPIADATRLRVPPARLVRFRSKNDVFQDHVDGSNQDSEWESASDSDESDLDTTTTMKLYPNQHAFTYSKLSRLALLAVTLALLLPVLQTSSMSAMGVKGGVIPPRPAELVEATAFSKRDDTNTDVCKRWSHQCQSKRGHVLTSC
jgi:hypothetical protein